MKKKLIIAITAVATMSMFVAVKSSHSYPQGAPSGVANDPSGGNANCTSCHGGTAANATAAQAAITSNIPAAGYTPGTVYTITGTVNYTGRSVFGFEISPQNSAGTKLGTITVTSASTTKMVGTKYITQTQAGTTGTTGTHTWTFNWTAPAAGSGSVTFWGSFLAANGNGSSSGDQTYKTSYTVAEAVASGVNEVEANTNALTVINLKNALQISYNAQSPATANVELYNLNGTLVSAASFEQQNAGAVNLNFDMKDGLNTGIYIVKVQQGTQALTKKLAFYFN